MSVNDTVSLFLKPVGIKDHIPIDDNTQQKIDYMVEKNPSIKFTIGCRFKSIKGAHLTISFIGSPDGNNKYYNQHFYDCLSKFMDIYNKINETNINYQIVGRCNFRDDLLVALIKLEDKIYISFQGLNQLGIREGSTNIRLFHITINANEMKNFANEMKNYPLIEEKEFIDISTQMWIDGKKDIIFGRGLL